MWTDRQTEGHDEANQLTLRGEVMPFVQALRITEMHTLLAARSPYLTRGLLLALHLHHTFVEIGSFINVCY
jgi:hypothetical protein